MIAVPNQDVIQTFFPDGTDPTFSKKHWPTPSNTPLADGEAETFQITHPFHPLSGRIFELITRRCNWGEERVYYHDEAGRLCSLPLAWTNLAFTDPFVSLAAGRSAFRVTDLLELARLIAFLSGELEEVCDAQNPADM